jgi:hypothetical protein
VLEVELDIFSGMPNPKWILSEEEEKELLDIITSEPTQISPAYTIEEQFSLGYRGLIVREIKTDEGVWSRTNRALEKPLPIEFRVGSKPARKASAAKWILQTSEDKSKNIQITDELREVISKGVALVQSSREAVGPTTMGIEVAKKEEGADSPRERETSAERGIWWACTSNYFYANAHIFNDPAYVERNNCYCFASNHLANVRYARPGRHGGHPAASNTCGDVIAGLYADGWKDGCQPNGLTIALVIWPPEGDFPGDYHFYRLVTGGTDWWWGHKPGGTPAKYTDDCGNPISLRYGYAPNNICRDHYTDFCGYFYQNNSTAFVA